MYHHSILFILSKSNFHLWTSLPGTICLLLLINFICVGLFSRCSCSSLNRAVIWFQLSRRYDWRPGSCYQWATSARDVFQSFQTELSNSIPIKATNNNSTREIDSKMSIEFLDWIFTNHLNHYRKFAIGIMIYKIQVLHEILCDIISLNGDNIEFAMINVYCKLVFIDIFK